MTAIMLSFHDTPFNRALRFEITSRNAQEAEIAMPLQDWFSQENGVVHGGIIASLADTTAVHALAGSLSEGQQMTGVEFKINFLRPARMNGGPLAARATIVRRGRTIALCDVDVRQDGEIVAKGLFTYVTFSTQDRS
jgi:uncharacterized protein (TIGR00369 family)